MQQVANLILAGGDAGSGIITRGNRGLDADIVETGVPAIPTLNDHPLIDRWPTGHGLVAVDARGNLASYFAEMLVSFEDQLANRQMQAEFGGRGDVEQLADIETWYRDKVWPLRDHLLQGGSGIGDGRMMVLAGAGRMNELVGEDPATGDRVVVRDLPLAEFAIAAPVTDPESAMAWLDTTHELVGTAVGLTPPAEGPAIVADDSLIPGQTVHRLSSDWLPAVMNEQMEFAGDLTWCWLVADGSLVMASSPRLAQAILTGGGAPTVEPGTVGLIASDDAAWGTISASFRAWADAALDPTSPHLSLSGRPEQQRRMLGLMLGTFSDMVALTDELTLSTTDDGNGNRHHVFRWGFAESLNPPTNVPASAGPPVGF